MKIASFRVVYFYNGIMDRPDTKWMGINNKLNNLFNGYPTILPYNNNMPLDFPYVQLKSDDGKYSLNMSKMRCDFIITAQLEEYQDSQITNYLVYINNLTNELANQKFARIGIVGRYIIESSNSVNSTGKSV